MTTKTKRLDFMNIKAQVVEKRDGNIELKFTNIQNLINSKKILSFYEDKSRISFAFK